VAESEQAEKTERVKQGYGEIIWPDEGHYLGHFIDNEMDGFGYMKNSDGSFYLGYFTKGQANGYGISSQYD